MSGAMCGLAGVVLASGRTLELAPALDALAHRGPDGRGAAWVGNVGLGHCRLAVIDPRSEAARQPMARDGRGVLALVGEVFDHDAHRRELEAHGERFTSRSDAEVLQCGLAREGVGFLRRVHAMFALAWLDPARRRLWLARDHAGIKPLYVWRGAAGVAFASEVRALARLVAALGGATRASGEALAEFLAYGSVPEPRCVLADVAPLAADTALEIDVDAPASVRAHAIGRRHAPQRLAGIAAVPQVVAAVREATARHLVADRPVALFLSAGLDSGVLALEAHRAATRAGSELPPVRALTVALGTRGARDEPAIVARFARRLGLPFDLVTVDDPGAALRGALAAYDQPSVDGLNTYVIARVAAAHGLRVALSGVGADEVFGGYRHLRGWPPGGRFVHARAVRLAGAIAGPMLSRRRWPPARRLGMVLEGAAIGEPVQRSARRIFSDSMIRALAPGLPAPQGRWGELPDDPRAREQGTYLRDTLLRDADVMGMAHGVEIRAPYLDPAVLDAADAVGSPALLDPRRPAKWVLREGWGASLERASLARDKSGFDLDLGAWLRDGDGAALLHAARARLARRAVIDSRVLARTVERWTPRLGAGHAAAWTTLFALIQLDAQLERWGEPG